MANNLQVAYQRSDARQVETNFSKGSEEYKVFKGLLDGNYHRKLYEGKYVDRNTHLEENQEEDSRDLFEENLVPNSTDDAQEAHILELHVNNTLHLEGPVKLKKLVINDPKDTVSEEGFNNSLNISFSQGDGPKSLLVFDKDKNLLDEYVLNEAEVLLGGEVPDNFELVS